MSTHNYSSHAARPAGHASMEVLTAAEADAIVGGGFWDRVGDFFDDAYKFGKKVYNGVKRAVNWLHDLFN